MRPGRPLPEFSIAPIRLDADREEGDDPRARIGGREGVDLLMPWKCTSTATSPAGPPLSEFGTIAIARPLSPPPVPAVSATSLPCAGAPFCSVCCS